MRWFVFFAGLVWASVAPSVNAADSDAGRRLYRDGVLGSGTPLVGMREGGFRVEGADAACANCHRRSGLGAKEGRGYIPPIAGPYLFHSRAHDPDELDLPYVDGIHVDREPYDDVTLARAIREGVDSDGRPLSFLMPRFDIADADMARLIAYLTRLDHRKVRGVTDTVLHFATVVTPDADPVKRRGMLDVLEKFFADKNAAVHGPAPRLHSGKKMMFRVRRRWELHVWELTGAPETWRAQLEQRLAREPVFATIAGIAGSRWEPVHEFCEAQALPCLFPNVDVPVESPGDYYSIYFSKGVLLEAGAMARRVRDTGAPRQVKVVRQIYRAGDSGERAAEALARELNGSGIDIGDAVVGGTSGVTLADALVATAGADVLVLWLRPDDLSALGAEPPAGVSLVLASGLMGGLERAPLPLGWRASARLTYPVDLPEKRRVRVDYALGWFSNRHIPVVAEQIQADTFLSCGLLAETLSHMVDTFVPDYLVERLQDQVGHRVITGYYPRLTLAAGQHFASKGAYLVRFADPQGPRLVAETEWAVP